MFNRIICGDCREIIKTLPSESFDLILTSPPYWYLRDYGESSVQVWGGSPDCEHQFGEDGFCPCGAWRGQLGLEPDWRLYVEHLAGIFTECKRVLKRHGNFVLNLGDTFARGGSGPHGESSQLADRKVAKAQVISEKPSCRDPAGMKLGIPYRVRFALNDAGWVSRDDIIWCISGQTDVWAMVNGKPLFTKIKDLLRLNGDLELPSVDQNGKLIWTKIKGYVKKVTSNGYKIVFQDGQVICATEDHKWLVMRSADTFKPVQHLKINKRIAARNENSSFAVL